MLLDGLIDLAGLIVMFALRVGVPLVLTLAFGRWLEKKLQPQTEIRRVVRPTAKIIPFPARAAKTIEAQGHCWDTLQNQATMRAQNAAAQHPDLPCWLALQADGGNVNAECFTCALYQPKALGV